MRWHRLIGLLSALAVGAVLGLVALAVVPRLAGLSPLTVLSGSMRPALGVGDVVIDEHIAPGAAQPGDIVSFEDRTRGGKLVTHRVRSVRRVGARVAFVTRGDANTTDERWSVPAGGSIGRVRWRVPKVGYVLHTLGSRPGRLGLVVVPAVLLMLLEVSGLVAVLRPRPASASASAQHTG